MIDNSEADTPTCGCLVLGVGKPVALTVDGVGIAGIGKTVVAGESCPQGKW